MKRMLSLVVVTWIVLGTPAFAQTPEPTVSYEFGVFLANVDPATGGQPLSATIYPVANATCGQAKVLVTAPVTNPTEVRFDDPADVTKDCLLAPASQVLTATPFGTGYRASLRARGATTVSSWSVLSNPFTRAAVPANRPTGVRVR